MGADMMREFKTGRLALTSAGCFLGAGYVSGQELWKFFGAFGLPGLLGRVLALAIQLVFVALVLRLGQETGITSLDRILIPGPHPLLHRLAGAMQLAFLFGVSVVMAAGAGALVRQLLSLPAALGGALFCVGAALVSCRGMDGLARVCTVLVPGMIVTALVISVWTVVRTGFGAVLAMRDVNDNPLLPNWPTAALTYVSYNIFGAIGVLTPIGPHVPDRRTVWRGGTLGVLLLLVISFCILPALGARPDTTAAELPMLALASELHPALGWLYAVLLLTGMLGTTVSFVVAIVIYLGQRHPALVPRRRAMTAGVLLLAFGGSLLGFGDLIGTVYPVFGYLGFAAMACLVLHWLRLRRAAKVR